MMVSMPKILSISILDQSQASSRSPSLAPGPPSSSSTETPARTNNLEARFESVSGEEELTLITYKLDEAMALVAESAARYSSAIQESELRRAEARLARESQASLGAELEGIRASLAAAQAALEAGRGAEAEAGRLREEAAGLRGRLLQAEEVGGPWEIFLL